MKQDKEQPSTNSLVENGLLIIQSPLADFPGTIEVSRHLDPATVVSLFKRMESLPAFYTQDNVPAQFREFYIKFPLFVFKIPGLDPGSWDLENGTGFPAALAVRCTTESSTLLKEALDLKN